MMDLIEGEDYLFNRYAFLGVDPNASDKEIAAAIRLKKSQNHPDRHEKVSDEARQIARRQWELADKCEETLTTIQGRGLFDAKLDYFKEHAPKVISDTGTAIFDPSRSRFDLNAMLGEAGSTENHDKLVALHAGFKPSTLNILEKVYQGDPTDTETRDAYRDILVKAMLHYDLTAHGVWEAAGVHIGEKERSRGQRVMLDDFSGQVEDHIQEIADHLPTRVREHYALLANGMAAPLRLTHIDTSEEVATQQQALATPEEIGALARENFLTRTHRVKELASKKQEVVGKLLDTMEVWPISPAEMNTDIKRFYLMKDAQAEESPATCLVAIDIDSAKNSITNIDISVQGKTLEELKAAEPDVTSVAVEMHPEIKDFYVYATHFYDKLYAEREGPHIT